MKRSLAQITQRTWTALVLVFAIVPVFGNPPFNGVPQSDWVLSSQKDGIEVYHKVSQCTDGTRILLQIHNTTSSNQEIVLECKILTGGIDIVVPALKNTVPANSSLEGTCEDPASSSAFIYLSSSTSVNGIVITIK